MCNAGIQSAEAVFTVFLLPMGLLLSLRNLFVFVLVNYKKKTLYGNAVGGKKFRV